MVTNNVNECINEFGNECLNKFVNEFVMKFVNNYVNFKHINYILIFLVLFCVVSMISFIIISYFILKFLKLSLDNNNILFYQYNKKSKAILDLYGNYKLTNMYLIRQPFTKFITFLLNLITFYNYEKLINETKDNFPYHTLIVFEIKLDNGMKKLLLLEKNNCINISDNFFIGGSQEIKKIKLNNKNLTINSILNQTQYRLGNNKYFNWNLYKNNCQKFTKEILKTIGKYNKTNKDFVFRDKIIKLIIPSEFTLHIGNCLCVFYNIVEKYIYDNNIFN
jgi:hypothetical protein